MTLTVLDNHEYTERGLGLNQDKNIGNEANMKTRKLSVPNKIKRLLERKNKQNNQP